jgi:lysophospholipase L1-like esterase
VGKLTVCTLLVLSALAIPSPASAAIIPASYTALGDSYSAGEGNDPFDGNCHRALREDSAYARMLPGLTGFVGTPNFHACTGAVIADIWQRPQPHRKEQQAQIEYVRPQDRLVTLTIGGNDLHFSAVILQCYVHRHCDRRPLAEQIDEELPAMKGKLVDAYQRIVDRMSPAGYLVVAGYPRLFSLGPKAGCNRFISRAESEWIDGVVDRGNTEIAAAAKATRRGGGHVFFVEVADDFDGHELCSDDPWLYGLTPSIHEGPFFIKGSYHPKREGQRAYAEAIAKFLRLPGIPDAITASRSPRSAYSASLPAPGS